MARIDKDPTPIQVANYVSNNSVTKNPNILRTKMKRTEEGGRVHADLAEKNVVQNQQSSSSNVSQSYNTMDTKINSTAENMDNMPNEQGKGGDSAVQTKDAKEKENASGLVHGQGWSPIKVTKYVEENITNETTMSNTQPSTSSGKSRIRYTLQDESLQDSRHREETSYEQNNDLQSKISNSESLIVKINRALSGEDADIEGTESVRSFERSQDTPQKSDDIIRRIDEDSSSSVQHHQTQEEVSSIGNTILEEEDLSDTNEFDPEGLMRTFVGEGEMINNLEYFIHTMTRGARGDIGDERTNTILLYERMIFDLKCEVSYLKKMLLILLKCR